MPQAPVIMIIRHAEKPTPGIAGVKEDGQQSPHDLIVRGWQRAGALATFFAPTHGALQNPLIVTPKFLFASAPSDKSCDSTDTSSNKGSKDGDESKSQRPEMTITPLAQKLQLKINPSFAKGQEKELATAAAMPGTGSNCLAARSYVRHCKGNPRWRCRSSKMAGRPL